MLEDFSRSQGFVELLGPAALEVDGVEQIADQTGVERFFVEHFLDHFLRVVAGPLVDDVSRLAVEEVAGLRLSIVEELSLLHEVCLQLMAFVHIDVVGYHHLRQRVEC